jgi:hypothetical protein
LLVSLAVAFWAQPELLLVALGLVQALVRFAELFQALRRQLASRLAASSRLFCSRLEKLLSRSFSVFARLILSPVLYLLNWRRAVALLGSSDFWRAKILSLPISLLPRASVSEQAFRPASVKHSSQVHRRL